MPETVRILITAGEASGDRLGANLMAQIRRLRPEVTFEFVGVGGRLMAEQGFDSLFDMSELSVLGLFEGVMALRRIQRRADDIAALARRAQPDLAVLIDSWGFSLRVAQRLRKLSPKIQIVKYVGPQVWASRPGRARTLAGAVDHLLSTQKMDAPFYAGLPLRVTFVGDPALNRDLGEISGDRGRPSAWRRINPFCWCCPEAAQRRSRGWPRRSVRPPRGSARRHLAWLLSYPWRVRCATRSRPLWRGGPRQ